MDVKDTILVGSPQVESQHVEGLRPQYPSVPVSETSSGQVKAGNTDDLKPGDDKVKALYQRLSAGNAVRGLPDSYNAFKSALADTSKRRTFYQRLQASGRIKGLPDDYDAFNSLWGGKGETRSEKQEGTPLPAPRYSPEGEMERQNRYLAGNTPPNGLEKQGNIDIYARPIHLNDDGSYSTVKSMSIGTDQGEVLIPMISPSGEALNAQQAVDLYKKTGHHLGVFENADDADAYSQKLHEQQAHYYDDAATDIRLRQGLIDSLYEQEQDLRDHAKQLKDASVEYLPHETSIRPEVPQPDHKITDTAAYAQYKNVKKQADITADHLAELQHQQLYATGTPENKAEMDEGTLKKSLEEGAKGLVRGVINLPKSLEVIRANLGLTEAARKKGTANVKKLEGIEQSPSISPDREFKHATLSSVYDKPARLIPYLAMRLGENAPSMLPGLGTAKLLEGASLGTQLATTMLSASPLEVSGQLEDLDKTVIQQHRKPTPAEKAVAVASGMFAAVFEGVGDVAILKNITKGINATGLSSAAKHEAAQDIAKGISDIAIRSARSAGESMVTEGTTEGIQQVIEQAGKKYGWDPNAGYFDGLLESVAVGGLLGAAMSGPATAVNEVENMRLGRKVEGVQPESTSPKTAVSEEAPYSTPRYSPEEKIQTQPTRTELQPVIDFTYDPDAQPAQQLEQLKREQQRLGDERARAVDADQQYLVVQYDNALDDVGKVMREVEESQEPTPSGEPDTPPPEGTSNGEVRDKVEDEVKVEGEGKDAENIAVAPLEVSDGKFRVEPVETEGKAEGDVEDKGKVQVVDSETGEPVSRQSKHFNPAFADFINSEQVQAIPRVEDAAPAAQADETLEDHLNTVALDSQNPQELIEGYEDTGILYDQYKEADQGDIFRLEPYKLRPDDVHRVMGSDFLPENRILYTETSKEGVPLDEQASIYSDRLNRDVTEQEVIERKLDQLRSRSEHKALQDKIKERFHAVTGHSLTPSLVREVQQQQTQKYLTDEGAILPEVHGLIDNYIDDQGRIDYTSLYNKELKGDAGKGFFTRFPGDLNEEQYARLKHEVEEKARQQQSGVGRAIPQAPFKGGQEGTKQGGTEEADESGQVAAEGAEVGGSEIEDKVKVEVKDKVEDGPQALSGSRLASQGGYNDAIAEEGSNPSQEQRSSEQARGDNQSVVIKDAYGVEREVQLGHLDKIQGLAMPELVRIVKELTGEVPGISTRFRTARGRFYPNEGGRLALAADVFQDTKTATKVLGHEIGHLFDYLPDETMARGNLLGRLKSLQRFLKTTAEGSGSTGKAITKKDRQRLKSSATKAVVEDAGVTLSEYIEQKEIRDQLSQEIRQRYKDYVKQEIKDRGLLSQEDLFNELYNHSKDWRPFDEAAVNDSYLRYRRSSEELYADALSALLTSPGTLEKNAPTFYKEFFAQLDRKPKVKATFLETQAYLNGGDLAVQALRDETIDVMFQEAEAKTKQLIKQREEAGQSFVSEFKQSLVDKWEPIVRKLDEAEKAGEIIPEAEDPRHILQELDYSDNRSTAFLYDVGSKVVKPIEDAGMSTLELGKFLLYNRVAHEGKSTDESLNDDEQAFIDKTDEALDEDKKRYGRAFMANPGGLTSETAQEQLDLMREKLGDQKFETLEQSARAYQDLNFAQTEQAVELGVYNKDIFEKLIRPNKYNYAAFRVTDYVEYPDYVNAAVQAGKGTFKDIGNPFDATLLKTLSLIHLNQIQRAVVHFENTWQTVFPREIKYAEEVAPGRFKIAPDKGQIPIYKNGKRKVLEVDPYIAQAFEFIPKETFNWFVRGVRWTNESIYRPLFITYNPAFVFWSNPNRDFKRLYRNLPEASLGDAIKGYIDSWQDAKDYSKGNLDNPRLRRLVDEFAIAPPGEGIIFKGRGDALGRQMQRFHLLDEDKNWSAKQIEKYKATRWLPKLLSWIRTKGSVLEILPKIAADRILDAKGVSDKDRAYRIRNYVGTPNFKAGGRSKGTSNAIYMFSNIFIQGYKADMKIATNPTSRGAFWMRTFMLDILPKLLVRGAVLGWFGKELKEFYDKASEYDKTNYVLIPLGWSEGGNTGRKADYLRIPQDETSRLISSMIWKLSGTAAGDPNNDLNQVFDLGANQVPGPAPALNTLWKWGTFLSGKNPKDDWRDRNILPQRVQQARKIESWPAIKKMVEWSINQTGLSSIATYNPHANNTTEFIMQTTPILNRMIKSTDYGALETQNALKDLETAKKQAIRLGYGDKVLNMVSRNYYLQQLGEKRIGGQAIEYEYLNNFYQQVYKPMDELIRLQREQGDTKKADASIKQLQKYAKMYEDMVDKSKQEK